MRGSEPRALSSTRAQIFAACDDFVLLHLKFFLADEDFRRLMS